MLQRALVSRILALFAFILFASSAFADCPGLQLPLTLGTGNGPNSIALGDFNGDGKLDAAISNNGSSSVAILLGNGSGGFPSSQTVSLTAKAIAAGDFNGDGKLDIVFITPDNFAGIAIGHGDGTFDSPVTAAGTLGGVTALVTGDFNRDGKLDFAVAEATGVTIFFGDGAGGFTQGASVTPAGTTPVFLAAADLNGDGRLDLAVVNQGSNNVTILLGDGGGGFSEEIGSPYAVGSQPQAVAVADFNRDGILDLAVVNKGDYTVSILLGGGGGAFAAAPSSATPTATLATPVWIGTADLTGDGKADLVIMNNAPANSYGDVTVFTGAGDGTFNFTGTAYQAGSQPVTAAIGDFTNDGKPDLAVVNGGSNDTSFLLNNSACTSNCGYFAAGPNVTVDSTPGAIVAGDFNHDGKLDVVTANAPTNDVSIALGNGSGGFGTPNTAPTGTNPSAIAAGDFDRDGNLDVVTADRSSADVTVILLNGDGTMKTATSYPAGATPMGVAVGDFNGDGILDLAVANQGDANVEILLGDGTGAFAPAVFPVPSTFAVNAPDTVVAADVNGDGKLDLVVVGGPGVAVLLGNGNGTFQTASYTADGTTGGRHGLVVADFNGDGKLDVALTSLNYNVVTIFLGDGAGNFTVQAPAVTVRNANNLATGDFNGDGKLDLVVGTLPFGNGGTFQVLTGNGDGTFNSPTVYPTGDADQAVAVGDFNRDGKIDIAVTTYANLSTSVVTAWLNDCPIAPHLDTGFTSGSVPYNTTVSVFFTVTNGNPIALSGINLTDPLPQGLVVATPNGISGSCGGTVTATAGSNVITLAGGQVAANSQCTFSVNITPTTTGQKLNIVSSISATQTGSAPGDSGFVVITGVGSAPTITESFGASSVLANSTTSLTLTIHNPNASMALTGVGFNDVLPSGLAVATPSALSNSCGGAAVAFASSGNVSLSGVTLAANTSCTVSFNVLASGLGANTNLVSAGSNQTGPGPVSSATLTVTPRGHIATCSGFAAASSPAPATGINPAALVVGDFNGDGKNDMAVANETSNTISIFLGNGNGTFGAPSTYAVGNFPYVLVTADFNADGKLDLATLNLTDSTVSVLLGNGNGTFGTASVYNAGNGASALTVGDYNGDGIPDLIVVSAQSGLQASIGTLLPGNGDGTFAPAQFFGLPNTTPLGIAAGDLNGDGLIDLVVGDENASAVEVLLNQGDGSFGPPAYYTTGTSPGSIAIVDVNGDGKPDLAVANIDDGTIKILIGNGDGTFNAGATLTVGASADRIAAGDFNGDGKIDLAVSNPQDNTVLTFAGNGDGTFASGVQYTAATNAVPFAIALADMNGDGKLDLVYADFSTDSLEVRLNNCSAPPPNVITDFNGDGKSDILLQNSSSSAIAEWQMNGPTITSGQVVATPGSTWQVIATGDFNGDGKSDILLQNTSSNAVAVWLMNGNTITSGVVVATPISTYKVIATGDFNGDGKSDIVLQNTATNAIAVWLMNGGSIASAGVVATPAAGWTVIATGDLNGDGKSDLVLQNSSSNAIAAWMMNGTTVTSGSVVATPASGWKVIATGDLNGDGKADLVLQNTSSNSIAGWLMNGATVTAGAIVATPAAGWAVLGTGDYNADGKSDLLLRNSTSGAIAQWLMNGTTIASGAVVATPSTSWRFIVK